MFVFLVRLYSLGDGEDVVIVHLTPDDKFYALGADCPHEGMTDQPSKSC